MQCREFALAGYVIQYTHSPCNQVVRTLSPSPVTGELSVFYSALRGNSAERFMNWDRHNFMLNSPVVPAGTTSLKCLTTSSLFEDLAFLVKQRIKTLVAASGSFKVAWSGCRLSFNRHTTSLQSLASDKRDSWTPPGRASAISLFSMKIIIF